VTRSRRVTATAGLVLLSAAIAVAAIYFLRDRAYVPAPKTTRQLEPVIDAHTTIPPPFVMFRALAPHQAHGRIAMMSLASSEPVRHITSLSCARLHYAGSAGLCFVEESDGARVKHAAYTFDRAFARGQRIELTGVPIRARVAPDGRHGAITVYGEEESPAGERLASESFLLDMASGRVVADLREFSISNPRHAPIEGPMDISGVAFLADSNQFFVTLSTASTRYLMTGSIHARRLDVVTTGVANEAVSPDGRRLVVKRRVGDRGYWQLVVLDIQTRTELALNQGSRSVDDQVEWLDADRVVYHDVTDTGTGIWTLPADGKGSPSLLIPDAFSPAVVR
jgi:hypothetical protein